MAPNVPDRLHRELARRAKARGQTLTDYIQAILEAEVARPAADEVFARIRARPGVTLGVARGHPGAGGAGRPRSPVRLVVLDASAAVEYLLQTASAPGIARIVEDRAVDLHVPALCDVEVAEALRRAVLQRRLPPARAEAALADYLDLPLRRHGHAALLPRILALRDTFSACNACYAALAERLGADLLTGDMALGRAVATRLALRVEHP